MGGCDGCGQKRREGARFGWWRKLAALEPWHEVTVSATYFARCSCGWEAEAEDPSSLLRLQVEHESAVRSPDRA